TGTVWLVRSREATSSRKFRNGCRPFGSTIDTPNPEVDVVAVGWIRLVQEAALSQVFRQTEADAGLVIEELVDVLRGRLRQDDTEARADRDRAEEPGRGDQRLDVLVVVHQLKAG